MIVDTSAMVAILFDENDAEVYDDAIASSPRSRMSVVNFIETAMVVEGRSGEVAGQDLDDYCQNAPIELEPVTIDQMEAARRAWRRFGKGNHPAGLNSGDCFAYALAETTREPLLFKGSDFSLTDIEST